MKTTRRKVQVMLQLERGGLWRNGKSKDWSRGDWGLIAVAAGQDQGVEGTGAIQCLKWLLKEFKGTEACGLEQITKAFFSAALKGRARAVGHIREQFPDRFAYWRPWRGPNTNIWELSPSYHVTDVADLNQWSQWEALKFWKTVSDKCVTELSGPLLVAMFSINRGAWANDKKQAVIRLVFGQSLEDLVTRDGREKKWGSSDTVVDLDFSKEGEKSDKSLFLDSECFVKEMFCIYEHSTGDFPTQHGRDYCLQIISEPQNGRMQIVSASARTKKL